MSVKYHISKGQARLCNATIKACPVGGSHFSQLAEANEQLLEHRKTRDANSKRIELLVKFDGLYSEEEKAVLRKQIKESMRTNPLPTTLPKGVDITNFAELMREPMVITPADQALLHASATKHNMNNKQMGAVIQWFDNNGSFALLKGAHMTRRVVAYARTGLLDKVIEYFKLRRSMNTVNRITPQPQNVQPNAQPTLTQRAIHYAGQQAKHSLKRGAVRVGKKMWVDFNKYTTVKF